MIRFDAMLLSALLALAPGVLHAAPVPARAAVANAAAPRAAVAARPLPGDSVLRLPDAFSDQQGRAFTLAQRRGRPQLVAMFYSSCPYACPLLIESGKGVEHALSPAERARLRVLYVSLDPARDDTRALAAVAAKRKVDGTRWTLARTDAAGVRRTAAVLGVRYRQLANGEFNHSSVLILLDADGRIVARTEKLGPVPDPAFVAKVRAAIAKS
jgi:protein SCO1/2